MTKGTFYGKILYYAKKIRAIEQLGGKCNKCNNNEIFSLCFHHKFDKKIEMNRLKYQSWSKIENEIKKCELLCHNCHLEHHFGDLKSKDNRFIKNKTLFLEIKKEFCCSECNYNKCNSALHFHHETDKLFNLAKVSIAYKTINDIEIGIINELNKCIILCANCHYKKHTHINFYFDNIIKITNKVINMRENSKKIDREIVTNLYKENKTHKEISEYFKCDLSTIYKILNESNVTRVKLKYKIIELYKKGYNMNEISKDLNISYNNVKYHIKNLDII